VRSTKPLSELYPAASPGTELEMKSPDPRKEAIAQLDGHVQLIACAGSGKTEVVARRVVNLLRPKSQGGGGFSPQNIIAFTFTEKAAGELKERIHTRCNEAFGEVVGLAEMYVGTIHGYCLELLKSEVPTYLKYEVLNEVQQILFIDRYSKATGLTASTTLTGVPLKRYVDTKNYSSSMSILREDRIANPEALEDCTVAAHFPSYEKQLHAKGYLDYSGILKEAVESLKSNPALRSRVKQTVRHVIVDEYQDVNPIQEAVVSALREQGAQICVVGDDDQTIYQWRGSEVDNILTFQKRYKNVFPYKLEENFRSSEGVVSVARDFVRSVAKRLPKEMKVTNAQSYDAGDIVALNFEDPNVEADYIAKTCRALRGQAIKDSGGEMRGISWSDMAILLRSVKKAALPIMQALSEAKIPFMVTGVSNLFDQLEAEAARQLFYFLAGSIEEPALTEAWESARLGLDAKALRAAVKSAAKARAEMQDAKVGQFKVYNLQRQFIAFIETAGLREERVPDGRGEVGFYNLGKFSQVISDFESIHFHSNPIEKYRTFAGFLEHHAENAYPEGWQENTYANPDAVRIMTVHQAKGLQWPAVFIPQLVRNRFPSRRMGGRTAWHLIPTAAFENVERYKGGVDDERRLFYVAATRAQKFLHMTWAPTPENSQAQRPSEFFEEVLASKYVKRKVTDYSARKKLPPKAKDSVANVVLSFSDVKYFFECPYQFKLRILYGFNAPLDEALGFGKSLHDVLAEVHKRALRGEKISSKEAEDLVARHLRVPYAYESLRDKMRAAAEVTVERYIDKNIAEFPNLEMSEQPIDIALGDGISVAGRIDLVKRIDTGEVTIVDLKSSDRAQSEQVTEAQLHIYALGYKELTGRSADYVQIYELDAQKQKTRSVDEAMLEDVKRDVRRAAMALRSNKLAPTPTKKTCGSCDYCKLCSHAMIA
jgi:DNA helicase II / ATP-dependent DNA helicase PcrA